MNDFLQTRTPRGLLAFNVVLAVAYFFALAFFFERGNMALFWLLLLGEVFHLWQALTFLHTIWNTEYEHRQDPNYRPQVDVFITVAGEPTEVVEETLRAALAMNYPDFTVYILNDGFVAKKANWQEIETLAARLGARCLTRRKPGGFKAGNINNGLWQTGGSLVAIFDADHVPHPDFLEKTVPYFTDATVGFVQSPQYYKNQDDNLVTSGAWEQQALFFGPICKGRNRFHSVTMCGTNMVIRREALAQVGGISEESIAEDFITGMFIHEKGWKSVYVPEVLAEGLAPEDFLTYYKQQFRWARGSMDLIFRWNPLFRRGLTWQQKLQYLSSVSFFLSGAVVLMNAVIPLVFFFTGLMPFTISTMTLALIFLPYILVTLYVLSLSSNYSFTFRSLAFAMAGFNIHIKAFVASLLGIRNAFAISSKKKLSGNFLGLTIPQLAYILAAAVGLGFALLREGITPALVTNAAWAALSVGVFSQFVLAALPERKTAERRAPALKPKLVLEPLRFDPFASS